MTTLQKLQLRQSEIREQINTLLGNDSRTEEQTGELEKLTGEGQKLEPEIRAAIVAAPDPDVVVTATGDAESRERIELRAKTGLADFFCGGGWRSRGGRSRRRVRECMRRCVAQPTSVVDLPRRSTGDPCHLGWTGR